MTAEQEDARRLWTVFREAARIANAAEREAYVRRACGDDRFLADKAWRLLRCFEEEPSDHLVERLRAAIRDVARELRG